MGSDGGGDPSRHDAPAALAASRSSADRSGVRVLFLVVAYRNAADVIEFVRALSSTDPGLGFAVCDNTETQTDASRERLRAALATTPAVVAFRPDNPGYLDGALAALAAWRAAHGGELPEWAVLSNTDLAIEGEPFSRVLGDRDHTVPQVLAPRLTEGPARVEKNPYQPSRRNNLRLHLNAVVAWTPRTAYAYLWLAATRFRLRHGRRGNGPTHVPATGTARAGTRMYAAYGATIVFSRGFLDRVGLPRNVPLLAEEFAIAEAARRAGVDITFEPRLHLHHDPHTTTGPAVTLRRAAMLSRAFRYISRTAS